jgi:hypothetical protein
VINAATRLRLVAMTDDRLAAQSAWLVSVICHLLFVIERRASGELARRLIMKTWIVTFLALVWVHSALAAATLQVTYQDKKVSLDASELAKLPLTEVEASDHQTKHRYSGVLVRDVLGLVGTPSGDSLRGKALGLVVRITANDNYSVVFALAEFEPELFEPEFSDRTIILADKEDGEPLPDNAAPFRIVIPGDTHPARWIRQVKSIEVISLSQ